MFVFAESNSNEGIGNKEAVIEEVDTVTTQQANAQTMKIDFISGGNGSLEGTVSFMSLTREVFETVVTSVPTPKVDEGYEFEGWYWDGKKIGETAEEVYQTFRRGIVSQNLTIVAKFVENDTTPTPTPPTVTPTPGPVQPTPPEPPVVEENTQPVVNVPNQGQQNAPIIPENNTETIVDDVTPETVVDNNIETVEEEVTPLATNQDTCALINLIVTVVTIIVALLIMFIKKTEDEETGKTKKNVKIIGLLLAIITTVLFFVTEDMRNVMVLVDEWTIIMLIIGLAQVAAMVMRFINKEEVIENTNIQ